MRKVKRVKYTRDDCYKEITFCDFCNSEIKEMDGGLECVKDAWRFTIDWCSVCFLKKKEGLEKYLGVNFFKRYESLEPEELYLLQKWNSPYLKRKRKKEREALQTNLGALLTQQIKNPNE